LNHRRSRIKNEKEKRKMKKIITLGMVLALLAAFALPIAALASDTDSVPVSGTVVAAKIDVTAPTFAGFTTFGPGENKIASGPDGSVTVTNNSQSPSGWTVTAKDITNGGYMLQPSIAYLVNKLYISPDNWSSWATADVGVSWINTSTLPTWLSQTVVNADPAGTYSITIVYTGSLSF
jgi:hypothetical protein